MTVSLSITARVALEPVDGLIESSNRAREKDLSGIDVFADCNYNKGITDYS